jgi:hypothetical protein
MAAHQGGNNQKRLLVYKDVTSFFLFYLQLKKNKINKIKYGQDLTAGRETEIGNAYRTPTKAYIALSTKMHE